MKKKTKTEKRMNVREKLREIANGNEESLSKLSAYGKVEIETYDSKRSNSISVTVSIGGATFSYTNVMKAEDLKSEKVSGKVNRTDEATRAEKGPTNSATPHPHSLTPLNSQILAAASEFSRAIKREDYGAAEEFKKLIIKLQNEGERRSAEGRSK